MAAPFLTKPILTDLTCSTFCISRAINTKFLSATHLSNGAVSILQALFASKIAGIANRFGLGGAVRMEAASYTAGTSFADLTAQTFVICLTRHALIAFTHFTILAVFSFGAFFTGLVGGIAGWFGGVFALGVVTASNATFASVTNVICRTFWIISTSGTDVIFTNLAIFAMSGLQAFFTGIIGGIADRFGGVLAM